MRPLHPAAHGIVDLATDVRAPAVTGTGRTSRTSTAGPDVVLTGRHPRQRRGRAGRPVRRAAGVQGARRDVRRAAPSRRVRWRCSPTPARRRTLAAGHRGARAGRGRPARDPRGRRRLDVRRTRRASSSSVGVTGTNGKTTTTYFLDAALRAVHPTTALLGTVELRIGERADREPPHDGRGARAAGAAARWPRGGRRRGHHGGVHPRARARPGARADVRRRGLHQPPARPPRLPRRHGRLLRRQGAPVRARPGARGVVVVDDAWGRRLVGRGRHPGRVRRDPRRVARGRDRGLGGRRGRRSGSTASGRRSRCAARTAPGTRPRARCPGLVNVSNAALAIVLAHARRRPAADGDRRGRRRRTRSPAAWSGSSSGATAGRSRSSTTPTPPTRSSWRSRPSGPITPGRLVLVFGSDGDRDQGKRPIMGEIARTAGRRHRRHGREPPLGGAGGHPRPASSTGSGSQRPDRLDMHEATRRAQAIRAALALADDRTP